MGKRFTDTEIWDKEWFMALSLKHKCLIRFIFDKCDVAGIWSPNWVLASAYIGEKVTENDLQELSKQVIKIEAGKFFVKDFVSFQYGELSEKCKPHQKVISILKKHNLFEEKKERVSEGYEYPLERDKEKEEVKEEEKDKETEKEKEPKPSFKYNLNFLEGHHLKDCFMAWLTYKRERKENYKSQTSLEITFRHLINISNNNPETAATIVNSAISGNIQGFYPVKNSNNANKRTSKNYDDLIAENRAAFGGTSDGNNSPTGWHRPAAD